MAKNLIPSQYNNKVATITNGIATWRAPSFFPLPELNEILVSEITNEEFRDHRIIAFESNPTWVNLESCNNVIEKVKKVKNASWGGSTNLEATFDMILSIVKEKK